MLNILTMKIKVWITNCYAIFEIGFLDLKLGNNAINVLMDILRHAPHSLFKTLPKDARALLKTPRKTAEVVALSENCITTLVYRTLWKYYCYTITVCL